jgi:hypothetical protein
VADPPSASELLAMLSARDFLITLSQPRLVPRIPREMREEIKAIARRYPTSDRVKSWFPDVWVPDGRDANKTS